MSGRRAKQERRMIALAGRGDPAAQQWCLARMTPAQIKRANTRHLTILARRA